MERTRKCYGRTDGRTDGQTKAISIIPHPLRGGGLKIFSFAQSKICKMCFSAVVVQVVKLGKGNPV